MIALIKKIAHNVQIYANHVKIQVKYVQVVMLDFIYLLIILVCLVNFNAKNALRMTLTVLFVKETEVVEIVV